MKRARALTEKWKEFRHEQDTSGRSYENLGRTRLIWYLDYCYSKYQELCYLQGQVPLSQGKWLTQELEQTEA